jgi:hypothetical protein
MTEHETRLKLLKAELSKSETKLSFTKNEINVLLIQLADTKNEFNKWLTCLQRLVRGAKSSGTRQKITQ